MTFLVTVTPSVGRKRMIWNFTFMSALGLVGSVPMAYGMTSGGMWTSSVASLHGPRIVFDLVSTPGVDVFAIVVRVENHDAYAITIAVVRLDGEVERPDHHLLLGRRPVIPRPSRSDPSRQLRPSCRRARPPPPRPPHLPHHRAHAFGSSRPLPLTRCIPCAVHHSPPIMPPPIMPPWPVSCFLISFFSLGTRLAT